MDERKRDNRNEEKRNAYCSALLFFLRWESLMFHTWRKGSYRAPSAELLPGAVLARADANLQTAGDPRATQLWPARAPAAHYAARGT